MKILVFSLSTKENNRVIEKMDHFHKYWKLKINCFICSSWNNILKDFIGLGLRCKYFGLELYSYIKLQRLIAVLSHKKHINACHYFAEYYKLLNLYVYLLDNNGSVIGLLPIYWTVHLQRWHEYSAIIFPFISVNGNVLVAENHQQLSVTQLKLKWFPSRFSNKELTINITINVYCAFNCFRFVSFVKLH